MRNYDFTPKNPQDVLNGLAKERQKILDDIGSPLGRLAARAASVFGAGPLADNAWQSRHTKKKVTR